MALELNESNFAQETGTGLVLVDFYATWCGPCKRMAPILEELKGAKVVKVNTDVNQSLALEHQVDSIPKFVFMKDGVVVDQMVGVHSRESLQARIDALLGE